MRPAPERILIIRPSALGDVCRSVPVLAALRRAWPEATIDWLVQDDFAAAIEAHPGLSHVIEFPRKRFAHWWRKPGVMREMLGWLRSLRKTRYDLVLDCQGLGRSALFMFATGAPHRLGYRAAREGSWIACTERVGPPESPHTVDHTMALIEHLGIDATREMGLVAPEAARTWWARRRTEEGFDDAPYAVLAPTSRWESKQWPDDRFVALVRPLVQRGFARVVVVGAPGEEGQIAAFDRLETKDEATVLNLVGELSLARSMAVIADAGLVIANDSAPLHLAVGFERVCIGLFGPTEPEKVGPYRQPEAVLRNYDPARDGPVYFKDRSLDDSLMRLIEVEEVLKRIDEILPIESKATSHPRA